MTHRSQTLKDSHRHCLYMLTSCLSTFHCPSYGKDWPLWKRSTCLPHCLWCRSSTMLHYSSKWPPNSYTNITRLASLDITSSMKFIFAESLATLLNTVAPQLAALYLVFDSEHLKMQFFKTFSCRGQFQLKKVSLALHQKHQLLYIELGSWWISRLHSSHLHLGGCWWILFSNQLEESLFVSLT